MSNEIFQGNWDQVKGQIQKTWGWLSNDDLNEIEDNHEEIYHKLQTHYGYSENQAKKAVTDFTSRNWH